MVARHYPDVWAVNDVVNFGKPEAENAWDEAIAEEAVSVVATAGFPCRDLSHFTDGARGLEGSQSMLIYEAARVLQLL